MIFFTALQFCFGVAKKRGMQAVGISDGIDLKIEIS
jgi:hypothetical protein